MLYCQSVNCPKDVVAAGTWGAISEDHICRTESRLSLMKLWAIKNDALQTLLKKRNEELQKMLDVAAGRPPKGTPPSNTPRMRVDLKESQILDNPTAYTLDDPVTWGQ